MSFGLKPWREVTRKGMPQMVVIGKPLTAQEQTFPVGAVFDLKLSPEQLRVIYEQRLIAPAPDPGPSSAKPQRGITEAAPVPAPGPSPKRPLPQSARRR